MLSPLIAQTLAEVFILSENRKITFSFILILEALSKKLNHIISQQCFVRWHDKKVCFSRRANNTDPGQTNLKQFCYCAQTCSVEEAPGKDFKFHRWANNSVLIYKNQEDKGSSTLSCLFPAFHKCASMGNDFLLKKNDAGFMLEF